MFLLVLAHLGSPGQRAVKRLLCCCFQDNMGKLAPERQTILDFTGARDDGVAVVLAGPCANHLHFAKVQMICTRSS